MRLWHQDMVQHLPKKLLLGQHRECCALRGKGWEKKHSTVQYALDDDIEKLIAYHKIIMTVLINKFNVAVDESWFESIYRGKKLPIDNNIDSNEVFILAHNSIATKEPIHDHHDYEYLIECLDNLWGKMTTETKDYEGRNYGLKYRAAVCSMFKKHYPYYIKDKIEEYLHYKEESNE